MAVANKPGGTSFNPFMIYGGVGLGKTHIVQALGNEIKALFSNHFVLYVSSEQFTTQFIEALRNNSMQDFSHFYLQADLLIIDDDDENRLLKPNQTKKALELITRALDKIAKERMTWTGPKGLGIDVGTPQESPRGPTQLRHESTLPDFDGEKKNNDETKEKKNERLNHIQVQTDEGENLSIDYDNDQPLVSRT